MNIRTTATRRLYRELMETRFAFMPSGEYTLRQVYAAVKARYEEWCDDTFLCNSVCTGRTILNGGTQFGEPLPN